MQASGFLRRDGQGLAQPRAPAFDADLPIIEGASLASMGDCSTAWTELMNGESRVVESLTTEQRFYLVTTSCERPSAGGCNDCLQRMLRGDSQKVISLTKGLAPSTVAANIKSSLVRMGVSCQGSKCPLIVVVLARAAVSQAVASRLLVRTHIVDRQTFRVIRMERPEAHFRSALSAGEFEVVRWLVEGKSYGEISALRRAKVRTVANQVASAFRKLEVSGRGELLGLLADATGQHDRGLQDLGNGEPYFRAVHC